MTTPTYSSGATNANTVVVVTDGKPTIGTDDFKGILAGDMSVNSAGTVTAQYVYVTQPIPHSTRIRGKGKTATNFDTQTELTGILYDVVGFDLTSSTYTIDETAAADTAGLMIVDGNLTKGTLDVIVDGRAMRSDIS
jgi:hypothetical protein